MPDPAAPPASPPSPSEQESEAADDGPLRRAVRTANQGAASAVSDGWVAGGSFFGSIMAGALLGWLADRWLDTDPWLVSAGIALGSVSGFFRMWQLVKQPTGKQPVRG